MTVLRSRSRSRTPPATPKRQKIVHSRTPPKTRYNMDNFKQKLLELQEHAHSEKEEADDIWSRFPQVRKGTDQDLTGRRRLTGQWCVPASAAKETKVAAP